METVPRRPAEHNETWRPVRDFEGLYEVSDRGRVRGVARVVTGKNGRSRRIPSRLMNPIFGAPNFYARISLRCVERGKTTMLVHRLVAAAFLGESTPGMEVNHRNGDKTDNRAANLEWVDHATNIQHAHANGLMNPRAGANHHRSKLTAADAREIRRLYPHVKGPTLAKRFGVQVMTIYAVLKGRTWRDA